MRKSFVITDADIVAGLGERIPGDVEPAVAGEELVGVLADFEELHESSELRRVFRTDIGSLAYEVLGIADTSHSTIYGLRAEARINDDWANNLTSGF